MTTEEKLAKALDFIKSIEKFDKRQYDTFDISDLENEAYGECEECGNDVDVKIKLHLPQNVSWNTKYIDYRVIDDLSNKAWHLLIDLTD